MQPVLPGGNAGQGQGLAGHRGRVGRGTRDFFPLQFKVTVVPLSDKKSAKIFDEHLFPMTRIVVFGESKAYFDAGFLL